MVFFEEIANLKEITINSIDFFNKCFKVVIKIVTNKRIIKNFKRCK